jgi:hypothetical protein
MTVIYSIGPGNTWVRLKSAIFFHAVGLQVAFRCPFQHAELTSHWSQPPPAFVHTSL